MPVNNIIFLDFDGVLNSERNYRKLHMNSMPICDQFGALFDEKCVAALEMIIEATKAEIVITSSWRYLLDLPTLRDMWECRGLPGRIISMTRTDLVTDDPFDNLIRGKEVEAWLRKHHVNEDTGKYVIIDDENEYMTKQLSHFVWTNPESGLTKNDAERAISILG